MLQRRPRDRRSLTTIAALALSAAVAATSVPVGCSSDAVPVGSDSFVPVNHVECPAVYTDDMWNELPCDIADGAICVYTSELGYNACQCGCREEGFWSCHRDIHHGPGCPPEGPEQDAACEGFEGRSCGAYDQHLCKCSTATHRWDCKPTELPWECIEPPFYVAQGSSGVDGARVIGEMSEGEANAWCAWFVKAFPPGGEAPPVSFQLEGDYARYGARGYRGEFCLPRPMPMHCAANLLLGGCEATVAQLDDCMRTIWNNGVRVGHGCNPFLAATGCEETMLQKYPEGDLSTCGLIRIQ